MPVSQPRYSKEEFARRGDEIYERDLRPHVEAGNQGKFIVIDIETGAYEIDADELVASDRLLARHPDAQVWLGRMARAIRVALGPVPGVVWHDHGGGHGLPSGDHPSHRARPDGTIPIEAVIDTGFDGALFLPPADITALGLPWRRRGRALLADGTTSLFDIYEATVLWDGAPHRVAVDAADIDPRVGMRLLDGYELTVQVIMGGQVLIKALP